jgi:hypothetical protein
LPIHYTSGDPLLTRAQMLAFGHNARGRAELGPVETALLQQYPAAFSRYTRHCRSGRIPTGGYWLWTMSRPQLVFLTVRASSVGATRLRYVQSALLALARDAHLHRIASLAIAPLGNAYEWPEMWPIIETWFGRAPYTVIVYRQLAAGQAADEPL